MNSKFLYFTKKELFEQTVGSFPAWLSPICFIEDSNEIWFNNHFFLAGHESLRVSEMDGTVIVSLSETNFRIVPGSSSINVRANGQDIVVSCTALTKIDTVGPLEWKENKLYHKESGIDEGAYGLSTDTSNAKDFVIPKITVDKYGHITDVSEIDVSIRDYTELKKSDELDLSRPILLSERGEDLDNSNVTRKAKELTYNNKTKLLTTGNLHIEGTQENSLVIDEGNLIVKNGTIKGKLEGEVQGTATPKIHLAANPDYGGASTLLYGHVKLVDEMPLEVAPSSSNSDTNNSLVKAEAASPYLVKLYVLSLLPKIKGYDASRALIDISGNFIFTEDFVVINNTLSLAWTEL